MLFEKTVDLKSFIGLNIEADLQIFAGSSLSVAHKIDKPIPDIKWSGFVAFSGRFLTQKTRFGLKTGSKTHIYRLQT